jgi:hypothetical protein
MTLPDGKSNKGRVQAFDGPIYIADAALYLKEEEPGPRHQGPVRAERGPVQGRARPAAAAAQAGGRYWHDAFVQIDDFTNEGVVASSSRGSSRPNLGSKKAPIATVVPVEGATGWADTHDDARRRQAPELRLHVAGALAQPQAAGRPRGLVRLGAGRARGLQGQQAARRRRLRDVRATTTSTRSASGARRSRSARARTPACRITSGSATTSRSWAAADAKRPWAAVPHHGRRRHAGGRVQGVCFGQPVLLRRVPCVRSTA